MENLFEFSQVTSATNLDELIRLFHGYGKEPLATEEERFEILEFLKNCYSPKEGEWDGKEWLKRSKNLSNAQLRTTKYESLSRRLLSE